MATGVQPYKEKGKVNIIHYIHTHEGTHTQFNYLKHSPSPVFWIGCSRSFNRWTYLLLPFVTYTSTSGLEVFKNRTLSARTWQEGRPTHQADQSRMAGNNWPDHGQIQSQENTGSAGVGPE